MKDRNDVIENIRRVTFGSPVSYSNAEWQRKINAILDDAEVKLWTCPDCAFTYAAEHTDTETGKNSCPVCELAAIGRTDLTTQHAVRQDSTSDQLRDLYDVAVRLGMYDAADLVWKAIRP